MLSVRTKGYKALTEALFIAWRIRVEEIDLSGISLETKRLDNIVNGGKSEYLTVGREYKPRDEIEKVVPEEPMRIYGKVRETGKEYYSQIAYDDLVKETFAIKRSYESNFFHQLIPSADRETVEDALTDILVKAGTPDFPITYLCTLTNYPWLIARYVRAYLAMALRNKYRDLLGSNREVAYDFQEKTNIPTRDNRLDDGDTLRALAEFIYDALGEFGHFLTLTRYLTIYEKDILKERGDGKQKPEEVLAHSLGTWFSRFNKKFGKLKNPYATVRSYHDKISKCVFAFLEQERFIGESVSRKHCDAAIKETVKKVVEADVLLFTIEEDPDRIRIRYHEKRSTLLRGRT